nr:hypothetical protein [Tanacetum cinerariifolium]
MLMECQFEIDVVIMLTTRLACRPSLISCLPSLEESFPSVPDAYAVSGMSGAETLVHTPAPGESEAQNRLPDSILSTDMSSASFAVTYTSVYIDFELGRAFWGTDEELSDGGSSRVIVYGYDGLPMLLVAPPSPDYIPGPEEPQTPPAPQDEDEHGPMFIQPHDLDFMTEPIYPEYIPLEDEHILLAEEQPLPPVVSPTAESPEDRDDDDGDSSGDDADDEDEEDEEHLASADFAVVIPTDELVSPPEGAEPAEVERLLAMPTPSPSPLASLSPPSAGERLARCTAPVALPSPPLPPPLHMSPPVDRMDDILETEMPPRKSTLDAEARRRGIGEVGYGVKDTWPKRAFGFGFNASRVRLDAVITT